MNRSRTATAVLVVTMLAVVVPACGKRGAPEPPEPRGPLAPGDLALRRIGPDLVVACTVSPRRGPRPSQDPVLVELLRVEVPPGVGTVGDADVFRRRGQVVRAIGDLDGLNEGRRMTFADPVVAGDGTSLEGWSVRFAVRTRDRRGRTSSLAPTGTIVPQPVPASPDELTATPAAGGIELSWETPLADATPFNVYRADGDGPLAERAVNPQPIEATSYVDASITLGSRYRYVVRAVGSVDGALQESASSPEAEVLAEDRFAPEPPRGLVAVQEGAAVRLFWNPGAERDLAGYRVERSVDGGPWTRVAEGAVTDARFLDDDVLIGQRLFYRVIAFDSTDPPNESRPSEEVVIVVAADPGTGGEP